MTKQLDGSFSGLWTCELCGHTGAACTCEHFSRWGGAWGPRKHLTDAETAAEYWRSAYHYYRTGSSEAFEHYLMMAALGEYHADIE